MATRVLKNAYLLVNSVDLSAHVNQISFSASLDAVEDTAMADNSRSYLPGLRNGTFTVNFNADDAAGAVSASLWTVYTGGAAVAFEVRNDAGSVTTTNPKYTGNCILTDYSPVDGSVGDLNTNAATFQITGDVTRATA